MCSELGYEVVSLHRLTFAGITLKGLTEGNWLELNEKEMKVIQLSMETLSSQPDIDNEINFGDDD